MLVFLGSSVLVLASRAGATSNSDVPGGSWTSNSCDDDDLTSHDECDDRSDEDDLCDDDDGCKGGETCGDPSDCTPRACDDGNPCTEGDSCQSGTCTGTPVVCTAADQCHVAGTCDAETGACSNPPAANGTPCSDGDPCTSDDACQDGTCVSTPIAGCRRCETSEDCADGTSCTTDVCNEEGVCENQSQAGCIPCTTIADCNDDNPCTSEQCGADGSCVVTMIPGCQRCETASECDDHDSCTADRCTGGVCGHDRQENCPVPPEDCQDGIDNDGDGLIDCADPDCATAPNCRPHEICGNCIDDDGDGLVDGEDPDCCGSQPAWMAVRKFMIKSGSASVTGGHPGASQLRLKTRYTMVKPGLFDPASEDTQVQVSDANGQIFCATVPAKRWNHSRGSVYRFVDKAGSFAGGLENGRFKVKRGGKIVFKTRGGKMNVRGTDGHDVKITVRVGNVCAQETKQLRTARKALVFP